MFRRGGITEAQFNKHLESKGFRRVRVRMECIVRYFSVFISLDAFMSLVNLAWATEGLRELGSLAKDDG